jgi:hypothetical protein
MILTKFAFEKEVKSHCSAKNELFVMKCVQSTKGCPGFIERGFDPGKWG